MKEKINYNNCIKRKCEQCKFYERCFRYYKTKNINKNLLSTKCDKRTDK